MTAKKTTFEMLKTCDWVYVLHKECGGFYFGAADVPVARRDIADALYQASKNGDQVIRQTAAEMNAEGGKAIGCKCFWEAQS